MSQGYTFFSPETADLLYRDALAVWHREGMVVRVSHDNQKGDERILVTAFGSTSFASTVIPVGELRVISGNEVTRLQAEAIRATIHSK